MPDTTANKERKQPSLNNIIHQCNLVRISFDHAFENNHGHVHRITARSVVMVFGVLIAQSAGEFHFMLAHIVLDGVGYLLHGIGAVPVVDWVLCKYREKA